MISFLFSGLLPAQVIENFEGPKSLLTTYDPNFTLVPNPDPTGVNTSGTVLKFVRSKDSPDLTGFSGFIHPLFNDGTQYFHVKVWKPRISLLKLVIDIFCSG